MNKIKFTVILFSLLFTNLCYSQIGWFWQNPMPTASHINDCFFVNQNTGFTVGYDGLVLKTTNAGSFWSQLNTNSIKTYTSVHFVSNEKGYLITGDESFPSNNYLLLTTNSGLNWSNIFTFPNQHLTKILFLNESTGFITGGRYWLGGRIHKTTNAGLNWLQYTPDPTTNFIYSIFFINKDTGYVTGDDGKILKTTNCGLNWVSLNSGTSLLFNDIYFINKDIGYVCGNGGKIYKTTNSGESWLSTNSSTNIDLFSINFINTQTGFAAGWNALKKMDKKLRVII
ncbi:MAG TPA: YCF48-related protein [Ignavibacteria bacterium]|nr:YCF48-related protein [Ignavibacteria bacterium]